MRYSFYLGIKRQSSNFLECIKTLAEAIKEVEVQEILDQFTILQNEIKAA